MASNQTKNYGLSQWERSDKVRMEDFNADNAKLDAALAKKAEASVVTALQTTVGKKAEQSALTALQTTVNGKASQTALDALKTTVNTKASQTALDALKNTLNGKGNCLITMGSYTGTGGSSVTIKTGFAPKAMIIMGTAFGVSIRDHRIMEYFSSYRRTAYITWESDGITLNRGSVANDSDWNNYEGTTYYYVALG